MRKVSPIPGVSNADRHPRARWQGLGRSRGALALACLLTAAWVARTWLRFVHRLRIEGAEHLPAERSFVLVANHASHLDTIALMAAIPWRQLARTHPVAAADYFFRHTPAALLSTLLINAIPFARGGGGARSLARCRALLARPRRVLILFPEGTRSKGGDLSRFRSGIGRLVAGTDVPVVPCFLTGAGRAWPKGNRLPRAHRLRLTIGPPRRYDHLFGDPGAARAIAEDLEEAVRVLGAEPPRDMKAHA